MGYDDYGPGAAGLILAYFFVIFLVAIAGYVLGSLFYMKIFQKAGVEGAWRAWVPVYNVMIFFKLGDLSPWLVLYGLAGAILLSWIGIGVIFSLAIGVLSALAAWRVGLKLQKDAVWVVLYVLLSIVWLGINAFDKSRWNPNIAPAPWAGNGFLGDRTVWAGIPQQPSAAAAPQSYGQGYGAPQGYAPPAPQGYAPPSQPGYAPPAQPGYTPPAQPGYAPPAGPGAPAGPGVPPAPAAPPAAPQVPPAPPAPPTAPPAAPPAAPTDPNQPPA